MREHVEGHNYPDPIRLSFEAWFKDLCDASNGGLSPPNFTMVDYEYEDLEMRNFLFVWKSAWRLASLPPPWEVNAPKEFL